MSHTTAPSSTTTDDASTTPIIPLAAPLAQPAYNFRKADFTSPTVHALLTTHHQTVTNPTSNLPGQKTYALDLTALQSANIHLWTLWSSASPSTAQTQTENDILLGCAALKILPNPPHSGELKSMHTISAARGNGIGKLMLEKIVEEARQAGVRRLYLETGSTDAFRDARKFYAAQGFVECGAFGEYELQENSVFMVREI